MPSERSERVFKSSFLALRSKARGNEQKKISAVEVGIFSAGHGFSRLIGQPDWTGFDAYQRRTWKGREAPRL